MLGKYYTKSQWKWLAVGHQDNDIIVNIDMQIVFEINIFIWIFNININI